MNLHKQSSSQKSLNSVGGPEIKEGVSKNYMQNLKINQPKESLRNAELKSTTSEKNETSMSLTHFYLNNAAHHT